MHRCTATCCAVPPRCCTPHAATLAGCMLQRCTRHAAHRTTAPLRCHTLHPCTLHSCSTAHHVPHATCSTLHGCITAHHMLHAAHRSTTWHTTMLPDAALHMLHHCTLHHLTGPPHGRVALPCRRGMISKYCSTCLPHPCQSPPDLQSRKLLLPPAHQGDERSCRAGHIAGPCGRFTGPR